MTIAQYENGNSVELEFEDGVYRCSIEESGTFICKVTLENGTVLFSDVVSVAETDIVHSYTNDEDVDCNECGATRVITPKPDNGSGGDSGAVSPDTGNGINMMLIVLLVGSFACATVILCTLVFNKKRYQ